MASVNKVIIVGNLGRDPETRYMPSGDAITNIAVATTDKWKDKSTGEQKKRPSGIEFLSSVDWQKWQASI